MSPPCSMKIIVPMYITGLFPISIYVHDLAGVGMLIINVWTRIVCGHRIMQTMQSEPLILLNLESWSLLINPFYPKKKMKVERKK